jgi:hypothetical protein
VLCKKKVREGRVCLDENHEKKVCFQMEGKEEVDHKVKSLLVFDSNNNRKKRKKKLKKEFNIIGGEKKEFGYAVAAHRVLGDQCKEF